MGPIKSVALDVHSSAVIRAMMDKITLKTAFIGELLQNAQRSGASQIDITIKEDSCGVVCFTLEDDGAGVDVASLFALGRTNVDEDSNAPTNPFGVGFAAVLHASEGVSIESVGGRCSFDVKSILARRAVAITDTLRERGSSFSLHLNSDLSQEGVDYLAGAIKEVVVGFPLPVLVNGTALPRPYALNSGLDFVQSELGEVALVGLNRWGSCAEDTILSDDSIYPDVVYVRGLPVGVNPSGNNAACSDRTIVHISHPDFHPILPDRSSFRNKDALMALLRDDIEAVYRKALLTKLGEASDPAEFVDAYRGACLWSYNLDLLDNLPIPRSMLRLADSAFNAGKLGRSYKPTNCSPDMDRPYFMQEAFNIHRAGGGDVAALWQYAAHQSIPIICGSSLPRNHSAHKNAIRHDGLTAAISVADGTPPAEFHTEEVADIGIVLCESVSLSFVDADGVEILPPITIVDEVVYADKIIYIPHAYSGDGLCILTMLIDYYHRDEFDDVCFDEYTYLRESAEFMTIVGVLRGGSQKDYLTAVINSAKFCPSALAGMGNVVISLGDDGVFKVH